MGFFQQPISPLPTTLNLTGQTVIVTGANAGMGLDAARQYLTLKASRVILAVRSITKGQEAAKYLSSHPDIKSSNPNAEIKVMTLDLDDYKSVVGFANRVKKELDVLDVLLLNGGVNIMEYQLSTSGHERVMQVNYHSNALLALMLLPLLESTALKHGHPARLTIVGSVGMSMHSLKKSPLGEKETVTRRFDDKSRYVAFQRYSDSKLMIAGFTQALAQHVPASSVVVNNLCPGMVATGFDAHLALWLKSLMWIVRKIRARSVEVGASTYVFATSVVGEESHGKFLASNKITE